MGPIETYSLVYDYNPNIKVILEDYATKILEYTDYQTSVNFYGKVLDMIHH